jgi:cation transport ATPase
MILAAFGLLTPLAGAITQEVIDILAVLNGLRTAFPQKEIRHVLKTSS